MALAAVYQVYDPLLFEEANDVLPKRRDMLLLPTVIPLERGHYNFLSGKVWEAAAPEQCVEIVGS